jgi:hypothetical protein
MKKKVLSRKRAIDLLHHVGSRLMLMHSNTAGMRWFILHKEDGGEVAESDALKIIERPDIRPMHGLFPGMSQSFARWFDNA